MDILAAHARRGGTRFATCTGAAFVLMLAPCAIGAACLLGWLPAAFFQILMAMFISGAAVGTCALLQHMFDSR